MCCHTEAGFVFFWGLNKNSERESLYEIQYSHGISVEMIFFFLVSSYGDLCFKGLWGNLKRSTEKNQNLKKDQLKKIFFLYGRVSLSWHWRYFGSDNSFHVNSIPNPSVTTKSISRYYQMLLWGKISLGGKPLLYGIFSIWVLIIFEERSFTSFQVHEKVMVDDICLHCSTLVLVYRTPFWS